MTRIVVLSDLHLSPTHGFFWDNWTLARDVANAMAAEAVVVSGDLCINGPENDDEIPFVAGALTRLAPRVLALPGNHDVGDEPPGQDHEQLVDEPRLARWNAAFGGDRWSLDAGTWRLVGVNAQLFGSNLAAEADQHDWLDAELGGAAGRPIALFLHKPLFIEHAGEAEPTVTSMNLAPRRSLLAKLREADVRLVVNGHLHQHRDRVVDGIRHVWAPSTAFMASTSLGGDPRPGMLVIDFAAEKPAIEVLRPAGMAEIDLATLKDHGRYKFLRDMPACPPRVS
jgi:3',5'-cyclic AMP phosphodiesterase CpdA